MNPWEPKLQRRISVKLPRSGGFDCHARGHTAICDLSLLDFIGLCHPALTWQAAIKAWVFSCGIYSMENNPRDAGDMAANMHQPEERRAVDPSPHPH
jgi:hypothetical protein